MSTLPFPRTTTDRLVIEDWQAHLTTADLRRALADMLTPAITRYLPATMQLASDPAGIDRWITDRQQEAQCLSVHTRAQGDFAGLILLHPDPAAQPVTCHLGYFLGEAFWGQGYASEALEGMITALTNHQPVRLLAGVDAENIASARVLEKVGFHLCPEQATPGRKFYERPA